MVTFNTPKHGILMTPPGLRNSLPKYLWELIQEHLLSRTFLQFQPHGFLISNAFKNSPLLI